MVGDFSQGLGKTLEKYRVNRAGNSWEDFDCWGLSGFFVRRGSGNTSGLLSQKK